MLRHAAFLLSVLILALTLAACGSGPRKRIFPPTASIQELQVQDDGQWRVQLRIQSFSNVPHTVAALSAQLRIGGAQAATLELAPNLTIGPQNAEIEELLLTPSGEAAARIAAALAAGRSVTYALDGTLTSTAPDKRRDDFSFEGQLWPQPGLPGVLR
ncbi:MAG TPA: hypothetical protein PLK29_09040 [Chiayiivirga sp.]|nr:hypothetical protein [Chiayiivirga sp.]